jgi:hypothetical protein
MLFIPVHPVCEMSTHYFSWSGGPGEVSIKIVPGHVTSNLCFASGRIHTSRSAFRCVRGAKRRYTIFHAWVGSVLFP